LSGEAGEAACLRVAPADDHLLEQCAGRALELVRPSLGHAELHHAEVGVQREAEQIHDHEHQEVGLRLAHREAERLDDGDDLEGVRRGGRRAECAAEVVDVHDQGRRQAAGPQHLGHKRQN
jgi:hypothetical protein